MDHPGSDWTTRDVVNAVFSDLKWLIAVSLFLTAVFFLPEQIRELYRTSLADLRFSNELKLFAPLLIIAGTIWLGSLQVLTRTLAKAGNISLRFKWWAGWIPPLLASLPLLGCALALFFSVPQPSGDPQVAALVNQSGSPFKGIDKELAQTVGFQLYLHSAVVAAMAVLFVVLSRILQEWRRIVSLNANGAYAWDWRLLMLTIILIAALTAPFVAFPVHLPQVLGVFGIIAAFTISVTAFAVHFSLLATHSRIPVIPIILICAALFSYWDLNDNHSVRTIEAGAATSSEPRDARSEFISWYESRPDRALYREEYPVYIVAAQGGGIYAAYQTAIFLARLQDMCPRFKNHLFAISSVSGGSVGAATFVAALNARETAAAARSEGPATNDPCPRITGFLNPDVAAATETGRNFQTVLSLRDLDVPGPLETGVHKALSHDFLSPLIAAALFPDFTQRFLPYPVPAFDRARPLEFAIEAAAASAFGANGKTLLDQPFAEHWNPRGALPALLMNTTDVGSGRRVLIAPFEIETKSTAASSACSIVNLRSAESSLKAQEGSYQRPSVRVSTAAVMSARFPWVTPAATVHVKNDCLGNKDKVRLVDGAYVDNSGVETALALIKSLENVDADLKTRAGNKDTNADGLPVPQVHLIVLSGGSFAERASFSLGEALEPIRALLSTQGSRSYVAIERARGEMRKRTFENQLAPDFKMELSNLRTASLVNQFYPLPLGWAMSDRTRKIIALQSGRFWDCEFDETFTQRSDDWSEADCIQMLTYHDLNRSLNAAVQDVALAHSVRNPGPVLPQPRHEDIIACYEQDHLKRPLFRYQAESVRALLRVWDAHTWLKDRRWLAYVLGTAAFETADFRITRDFLFFNSAERILRLWPARFKDVAEAERFINKPEELANHVYGYDGNTLGNTQPGDGWRYRGRGFLQIVGRGNYRRYGGLIALGLEDRPELVLHPDVAARVMFAYFFPSEGQNRLSDHINSSKEDWEGARRLLSRHGAEQVTAKSRMFLACIDKSERKASVAEKTQ